MDKVLEKLAFFPQSEEVCRRLFLYAALLKRRAAEFSLVAPSTLENVWERHFLDSLYCLDVLLQHEKTLSRSTALKVIDVGSGAGFPGLVIAAVREDFAVTLLDSNAKRCGFLREVAAEMGLENVEVLNDRAERTSADLGYRETYDAAVSRAVAPAAQLVELCAAFVRRGGVLLAMKSQAQDELAAAQKALQTLGFSAFDCIDYMLGEAALCIARARKVSKTPLPYPRPWPKIKAKPL